MSNTDKNCDKNCEQIRSTLFDILGQKILTNKSQLFRISVTVKWKMELSTHTQTTMADDEGGTFRQNH